MSDSIQSFDPLDVGLLVLGLMSAFMLVGIASFDLFGVDFSEEMTAIAGFSLSTAWVLGYAAIAGTIITNDNTELSSLRDDVEQLDQYYAATVVLTLALPVAFIVFPDTVGDFFQSEDLWGVIYVGIVTTGQAAMGWML